MRNMKNIMSITKMRYLTVKKNMGGVAQVEYGLYEEYDDNEEYDK